MPESAHARNRWANRRAQAIDHNIEVIGPCFVRVPATADDPLAAERARLRQAVALPRPRDPLSLPQL